MNLFRISLSLHHSFPQPHAIDNQSNFTLQARKAKAQCERSPSDKIDIEYDSFAEFGICAASYTPIYGGTTSVTCPFDGAKFHEQYKKTVCTVCGVCEIGAPASGLRLWAPTQ